MIGNFSDLELNSTNILMHFFPGFLYVSMLHIIIGSDYIFLLNLCLSHDINSFENILLVSPCLILQTCHNLFNQFLIIEYIIFTVITLTLKYLSVSLIISLKRFLNILPGKIMHIYLYILASGLCYPHKMSCQVFLLSLFSKRFCVKLVLILLILFFFSTQAFKAIYFPLNTALTISYKL